MRDYGKVHSAFWSSPTVAALSDDAKLLALYLMTCQHNTIAGVFRLPDGYASEDLGWGPKRVAQGFDELFENGFARRCNATKWVWICKHLIWNPPENPNQRKAVAKMASQVPDLCAWQSEFLKFSGDPVCVPADVSPNAVGTVGEPLPNQKQEQEQKKDSCSELVPESQPLSLALSEPIANVCPSPDAVVVLPLVDGSDFPVLPGDVREWSEAFPAVAIEAELRKAKLWLKDNPSKRKTRKGIRRFVTGWLAKRQDRGGSVPSVKPVRADFKGAL
jgi:hypothetical protein